MLATAINLKEIRAVATVMKTLRIYRKALTLAEVEELSALLPIDGPQIKSLSLEIEKKYHITQSRLNFFTGMPEIQALLQLLRIMKMLDSHNDKEVILKYNSIYRLIL
jgi:hypothetical protein